MATRMTTVERYRAIDRNYKDILKFYKPKYFLLENVKMNKEYQNIITNLLGVEPVLINSTLVSAQNRERLYWCNWNIDIPNDRKILLPNIIEKDIYFNQKGILKKHGIIKIKNDKSNCIDANYFKGVDNHGQRTMIGLYGTNNKLFKYRKLTPIECERLQTVPDDYTAGVSTSQRYKMLGNGWTVDAVSHIFKSMHIKKEDQGKLF